MSQSYPGEDNMKQTTFRIDDSQLETLKKHSGETSDQAALEFAVEGYFTFKKMVDKIETKNNYTFDEPYESFIGDLNHHIRNPLAIIMGCASSLERDCERPADKELCKNINKAVNRIVEYLEELKARSK